MSKARVAVTIAFLGVISIIGAVVEQYELPSISSYLPNGLFVLICSIFLLVMIVCSHRVNNHVAERKQYTSVIFGLRKIIAACAAFFFPTTRGCKRCHMPWAVTKAHRTSVPGLFGERRNDIFALCESCFCDLSPEDRVEFYLIAFTRLLLKGAQFRYTTDEQGWVTNADWELVKEAVLSEECCDNRGNGHGARAA